MNILLLMLMLQNIATAPRVRETRVKALENAQATGSSAGRCDSSKARVVGVGVREKTAPNASATLLRIAVMDGAA